MCAAVVLMAACSPSAETATDGTTTTAGGARDEVIAELTAFVEEARGLEFLAPVDVELVDDEEFERRVLAELEGDREELARVEPRFRALGVIAPDDDLYGTFQTLLGIGVVGYYDPETGELVVRGAELSVYGREVVVHELVHALDDQHFDIGDDVDPWSDDPGLAVLSAIEGSAERVRAAYTETLSEEERDESTREQLRAAGDDLDALLSLPQGLVELLAVPYQRGLAFAEQVVEEAGVAALDDALGAAPPDSMEQILRPDAYLDDEPVVPVEAPGAGGAVVDEGVLGQHYLSRLLRPAGRGAGDAAAGWGGDRYVVWTDGSRSCIRVAVATDTVDDHEELASVAERWAEADAEAAVATLESSSALVTLTRCA